MQRGSFEEFDMQPELAGMLAAIEAGDVPVIGMLADWLEERGDPRSALARAATQIDVEAVADTLYLLRSGKMSRTEVPGMVVGLTFLGVSFGDMSVPTHPFVTRNRCLSEVREAIAQRKLSGGVGQAIAITRRSKIAELLLQFKETMAAP
jgi:hypothetical protein